MIISTFSSLSASSGHLREHQILTTLLTNNEKVGIEVVEHRLGGARFFEPAHAFATDYRVIVIRGGIFRFQEDFKIIDYQNITEIKVTRDFLFGFSKVHFSLQGESEEDSLKWLVGIKYSDAVNLVKFVNEMKQKPYEPKPPSNQQEKTDFRFL
jgi:hypothetical protein